MNESFVRQYLAGRKPIGVCFRGGSAKAPNNEIIGIPGDAKYDNLRDAIKPTVEPDDPLNIAAIASILLAVAAVAGYIPARRASRVDPTVALRYE